VTFKLHVFLSWLFDVTVLFWSCFTKVHFIQKATSYSEIVGVSHSCIDIRSVCACASFPLLSLYRGCLLLDEPVFLSNSDYIKFPEIIKQYLCD